MEEKTDNISLQTQTNTERLKILEEKTENLLNKIGDLENRLQRNNLRIRGILVAAAKLEDYCEDFLEFLGLLPTKETNYIEKYHRVMKPKSVPEKVPRDVILCLHSFRFKTLVVRANAFKDLKDSSYSVK
ncbi:Hypothetical predicted protein [Pelobates cultripes]|uniref:Uncharacterized protein n=1 Tax=Pelobates cultripes TaxID=61616 RepID=A0AAD1SM86_PELCU|nr:Hypothetical predicted protein [Pelobates cultripes]